MPSICYLWYQCICEGWWNPSCTVMSGGIPVFWCGGVAITPWCSGSATSLEHRPISRLWPLAYTHLPAHSHSDMGMRPVIQSICDNDPIETWMRCVINSRASHESFWLCLNRHSAISHALCMSYGFRRKLIVGGSVEWGCNSVVGGGSVKEVVIRL